jgi:hypothetical protein
MVYNCGAQTSNGDLCQNKVMTKGDQCWRHAMQQKEASSDDDEEKETNQNDETREETNEESNEETDDETKQEEIRAEIYTFQPGLRLYYPALRNNQESQDELEDSGRKEDLENLKKLEPNEVLYQVKSPYFFGLSPEYIDYQWNSLSKHSRVNVEAKTNKPLRLLAIESEHEDENMIENPSTKAGKQLKSQIDGYIMFLEKSLSLRKIFLFHPAKCLSPKLKQIRLGKWNHEHYISGNLEVDNLKAALSQTQTIMLDICRSGGRKNICSFKIKNKHETSKLHLLKYSSVTQFQDQPYG